MTRTTRLQRAALRRRAPKPPSAAVMQYRAALRGVLRTQQAAILDAMLAAYVEPKADGGVRAMRQQPGITITIRGSVSREQVSEAIAAGLATALAAQATRQDAAADGGTGAPLEAPLAAIDRAGASVARKATDDVARVAGIARVGTSRAMTPAEVAAILDKAKAKGATRGELGALRMKLAAGRRLIGIERGDPARLERWRARNVALVKSIAADQKAQLKGVLRQATAEGWHRKRLREAILDRFDVARSRADLIARDQILTLNAQLAKDRQTSIGIEEYDRLTAGDERVSEECAALDGQRFRWDSPPPIGHPGEAHPGCRCQAAAVVPWLEEG